MFIFIFKRPKKFISWTSRKTQMRNCFYLVPNIVETPMEALPLLVIYLFKHGVLDFVLNQVFDFVLDTWLCNL